MWQIIAQYNYYHWSHYDHGTRLRKWWINRSKQRQKERRAEKTRSIYHLTCAALFNTQSNREA